MEANTKFPLYLISGKLITEAFEGKWSKVEKIASTCEFIHNGTLIADDIEDESEIRRGKPCIHLEYGKDIAINLSSLCYVSSVNSWLAQSKEPANIQFEIMEEFVSELTNIHMGQGWDILWHKEVAIGKHEIPTVERYLDMVSNKTGVLARLIVSLTCIMLGINGEVRSKLVDFAESLGIAFQIQDDVLNLVGEEFKATKGQYGEDIHEGKISLIVIHALNKASDDDKARLFEILGMKTNDFNLIDEAISILKKYNSIKESSKMGRNIVIEAWRKVRNFIPDNSAKTKLYSMALYVVERKI